jgi:parvulin-like peptidyl-prolyl isomerase
MRKILTLLMAVLLVVSVLAGCKQTDKTPFVSETPSAEPSAAASPALNLAGAYASMDPNTVMMTVNGREILWSEFFYLVNYMISDLQAMGATIEDWTAEYADGKTYQAYIVDKVVDVLKQNGGIEYGAAENNITLTDEDKAAIQADWEEQVSAAGSEEALLEMLTAQFGTQELFERLYGISYLADACFAELYGTDGSKLSDQEVADHTAEDGYLMAKHILVLTTKTDETGTSLPMSEEEKAAALKKAEGLLKDLQSYKGDDFEAYFDEVMNQSSEDPGGIAMYPDGYLFQSGDMVPEFEEGTKALEIGELSGIIETGYGYHIIYRLPINYDATPMAYANYGTYSLRYVTAVDQFKSIIETWKNSLKIEYTDAYNKLDFAKMFAA